MNLLLINAAIQLGIKITPDRNFSLQIETCEIKTSNLVLQLISRLFRNNSHNLIVNLCKTMVSHTLDIVRYCGRHVFKNKLLIR